MPRIKDKYFFLGTTSDEYELPVAVFESTSKLSRFLGLTQRAVQYAVSDALLTCPPHLLPSYIVLSQDGLLVFLIPESEI